MKRYLAAAALAAAAVAALAGCSSGPSAAGCKAALKKDFAYALAHPDAKAASPPAACKGLSQATLEKITGQVLAGQ